MGADACVFGGGGLHGSIRRGFGRRILATRGALAPRGAPTRRANRDGGPPENFILQWAIVEKLGFGARVAVAWVGLAVSATLAAGCSSSDEPSCGDVTGTWQFSSKIATSGCAAGEAQPSATSATVARDAAGAYTLSLSSLPNPCPATFDAAVCRLTAKCEVKGPTGSNVAVVDVDYAFEQSRFTGKANAHFEPPAVAAACDVVYDDVGTR